MEKIAWCIITDNKNDLISLKRFAERQKWLNSKYTVLALIGDSIKEEDLYWLNGLDNLEWRFVPEIQLNTPGRYKSSIMKATALLQTDYDLLCFIETDIIIKGNIDFIIDENKFSNKWSKTNLLFFDDMTSWELVKQISGLSFLIKPNKQFFIILLNYLNETMTTNNQVVDETFFTDFLLNKLNLSIEDIVNNFNSDYIKKLKDILVHFPGAIKPWTVNNISWLDLFYNYSFTDFNLFIDNNLAFINKWDIISKFIYDMSSNMTIDQYTNIDILKELTGMFNDIKK